MRNTILTLMLALFSTWIFGQNENPYSQFGYEAPIMKSQYERNTEKFEFLITNEDTTSLVAYLIIDTEKKMIKFYSDESKTLFVDTILSYDMARWLSPDPAYQHNSPYLGMGNNPINRVDPDGAVDLGPFGYFNNFNDFYIHFAGLNFRNLGTGGGTQFWSEGLNINATYKIVANVNYNHLQNISLIAGRSFSTRMINDNGRIFERTNFQTPINLNGSGASKYKNFSHIQGVQFTMSPDVTVSNQRGNEIFQSTTENRMTGMLPNQNYYLSSTKTINPINREVPQTVLDPNNVSLDEITVYGSAGKSYSKTLRIKATPAFFEEIQRAGIATVAY